MTMVSELTVNKFTQIIEEVVERKLLSLLSDSDKGLELQPEFEQRLQRSLTYVANGGKTLSIKELTASLEVE